MFLVWPADLTVLRADRDVDDGLGVLILKDK